ncbi:MAG TPA: dTDP-4-dehydrorhamnose reductase [Longimicrobiales bacterium]|nr:dTDP-4-dehydrorhamnose reductase [Longimicrobiales bacterium]
MKLLVTGARGLLGTEVARAAERRALQVTALGRDRLDVTDPDAVRRAVDAVRPDAIVHCAAFTAVDRAEAEASRAMAVNREGTAHAARAAREVGARFVYVSSDYVFDGALERPYRPDDPAAPLSSYGRSKLAGEHAAHEACDAALIARTSWLFGHARRSFVTAMIDRARAGERLRVVDDQRGGPSFASDVAVALLELVERNAAGVWHVANRGVCTWAELAREALRLSGLEPMVDGVASAEWAAPARRPPYSVLDVRATEEMIGRPMPHGREALARFLEERRARGDE